MDKPDCPYCLQPMMELRILIGSNMDIVFTCDCDKYIEAEIEETFEEANSVR